MSVTARKASGGKLPEDLEKVFNEHGGFIFRVAYHVTGNTAEAEDVLQTVFLRLLGRERPLDIETNPRGYLYRAAVNIALDLVRRRGRNTSSEDVHIEAEDGTPNQERQYASIEIQAWFRQALSGLNSKAAEMFVLKHLEGHDNHEIAQMLGTTRGTVAVTLFRARALLKKSIRSFLGEKS